MEPKIRLCIITRFYPPDFAATGQLIDELARYLETNNLDVEVFTSQPGYAFSKQSAQSTEVNRNLTIQRIPASRFSPNRIRGKLINGLLYCLRVVLHLLRSVGKFDVVMFTTEPPYLPILGFLVHKLTGLPYICLIYDLYPDIVVKLNIVKSKSWLIRVWHWLNNQAWNNAKAVIVLSSTMRDRLVNRCPRIAHKIFVVPNWSDPTMIRPIPKLESWFVHQHQLSSYFTVLYSGNLGRCHDVETIMEAARLLQPYPVRFVFIGAGAAQPYCMERIQVWNLDNCLFIPYQEKQHLSYSLAAADLALVSIKLGLDGTTAPSKLYSMMAAGRPIAAICEPHSDIAQILQNAGCGRVILNDDGKALADYVLQLMVNPELVQTLGSAARHYFLQNYTLKTIGPKYLEVLRFALLRAIVQESSPIPISNAERSPR